MSAFTAKVWQFDKAPRLMRLDGDKAKKVESAQHIIEFPGGAIEVSRLDDGSYWAHIIVNNQKTIDDAEGRLSAYGEVVDDRIDYSDPVLGVCSVAARRLDNTPHSFDQLAIRIKPVRR